MPLKKKTSRKAATARRKRALVRDRIPPDTLARLHAIALVQKRPVFDVLEEALKLYQRAIRKK